MTEPPSAQIAASIYLYPGFYLVELVPKGPLVAAAVTFNETNGWFAACGGEIDGPTHEPWGSRLMEKIAIWGKPCSGDEYQFREAKRAWAAIYKPDDPAANPTRPVDRGKSLSF